MRCCPICTDELIPCSGRMYYCQYCQYKERHTNKFTMFDVDGKVFVIGVNVDDGWRFLNAISEARLKLV